MNLLVAALVMASIFFASHALLNRGVGPTAGRLAGIAGRGLMGQQGAEDEHSTDSRILLPLAGWFGMLVGGVLPSRLREHAELQLTRAGNPALPSSYMTVVLAAPLLLGMLGLAAAVRADAAPAMGIFLALAPAVFGVMGPNVWLKGRVARRQVRIQRELPDALDLIIVSVEAGLGLEAAMARVAESGTGPVAVEFHHVLSDMNLGFGRRRAMQGLAMRTGVPAVSALVAAIIQADQTGMGLGQVLRAQGDHLRMQRRQKAEETAMKAPLKMLFPLIGFIFPALFVVILAPAVLSFMKSVGAQ